MPLRFIVKSEITHSKGSKMAILTISYFDEFMEFLRAESSQN